MTRISVGCGVSAARTTFSTPIPVAIAATVPPAMSPLYDGQAVQDVPGYAAMVGIGNFSSSAGTISSAVVAFTGDAVDASSALFDGDLAGFTVTVTDSADNVRVFTASQITVVHAAPAATGGIADQTFVRNGAITPLDVSADVTGLGLTYALAPSSAALPAGLSLSASGTLSGTPTALASALAIVVRATNSGGFADTAFAITVGAAEITATIPPAMSPLYDGQAVQDVPGYAAMVGIANFASSGGAIASAVVAFLGDAIAADDALVEGETAGFAVTVTDSTGHAQVFTAAPVAVQFEVRVNQTAGNEAYIEINPLVPDEEPLTIGINAGPYAGTYTTLTAGDLRDGPANFPGTIAISGTTGLGDTLTADDGLWTTPTDALTLTRQWYSDGAAISGATGAALVITALEQGTDITVHVTGNDGVNPTVTAASSAVGIPPAAAGVSVIYDPQTFLTTNTTPLLWTGIDWSAVAPGDMLVIAVITRDFAGVYTHDSMTVGGVSAALAVQSDASGEQIAASFWTVARPAATSGDISVAFSESMARARLIVWGVPAGTSVSDAAFASTDGSDDRNVDVDTVPGDVVLLASVSLNSSMPVLAGVSNTTAATADGGAVNSIAGHAIATATETRAMTSTTTDAASDHAAAAITVSTS